MTTVHFVKNFHTGNLAGLSVPCSVRFLDADHAREWARTITTDGELRDVVTGARSIVSDVRVEVQP